MFSFLKGNILVMTITRCLGFFSRGAAFPYATLYVLALGGTTASVGLINSLRPLAGFLIFPIAGYIADRRGRVKLIVIGTYILALSYCFYVFAYNWIMIGIGSFISGLIVFHFPALSALVADSLPPKQRGIGFATFNAVPGAVAIVAPFFAGYIIDELGTEPAMRYLYAILLISYALSATVQMKFLKETKAPEEFDSKSSGFKTTLIEAYRSAISILKWMPSSLRALAIIITLSYTANAIAGAFWVVYATQVIGLSTSEWGLLLLIYSALRIVFTIPGGASVDRFGRRKTIIASLIITIPSVLSFVYADGLFEVLLILICLSIANAFLIPACSSLIADIVPRDLRGRVTSAMGSGLVMISPDRVVGGGPGMGFLFAIPVVIGSVLGGYIYSVNPIYPWIIQSLFLIGSLLLSLLLIHEPKEAQE